MLFKNTQTLNFKKPPSQLRFSLPPILTTISEPCNTETHKTDRQSTNHKSETMTFWTRWCKLLFPKRSAKMMTAAKNTNVSWLLNFRILRVYEKRSNIVTCKVSGKLKFKINHKKLLVIFTASPCFVGVPFFEVHIWLN